MSKGEKHYNTILKLFKNDSDGFSREIFTHEEEATYCPLQNLESSFLHKEETAHCPFLHNSS